MSVVSSTVTRELSVQVVAPSEGPRRVVVVLRYDTLDPYAVHAVFRVGQGQQVTWVFARELMTHGLDQAAGDGDVRIWPGCHEGRDVVRIALRSPDGEALLQAPLDEVVEFLSASYGLCPRGREQHHLDIDRALGALFAT
jgi:Streptomyces sporulation and cell division protein, SsgA